jgi:hypothetical protein
VRDETQTHAYPDRCLSRRRRGRVSGFAAQRTLRNRQARADHAGVQSRRPLLRSRPQYHPHVLTRWPSADDSSGSAGCLPNRASSRNLFGAHKLEAVRTDTTPGESPCSRRPHRQNRLHDRHRNPLNLIRDPANRPMRGRSNRGGSSLTAFPEERDGPNPGH